jgi:hypothetical protein
MPVIDLSSLDGDATARKAIATKIKAAAENTGFFYVCNHGIPQGLIEQALEQVKAFFNQEQQDKDRVSFEKAGKFCGYHGVGSTQINNQETRGRQTADSCLNLLTHTYCIFQTRRKLSLCDMILASTHHTIVSMISTPTSLPQIMSGTGQAISRNSALYSPSSTKSG